MSVRYLGALALVVLGVTAPGAAATTITLTMDASASQDIRAFPPAADGTRGFGWFFTKQPVQAFRATVAGDDGQPVLNACLADGARIELLDARLQVRSAATCTGTDGSWSFVLVGAARITRPDAITAQLLTPTTTHDGRALAPASSNRVVILMAPKITNTMPSVHRGATYPLSGYVTMPAKLRAQGTIALRRRAGGTWKVVQRRRTDSSGRFRFVVPYGTAGGTTSFRYEFVPPAGHGWIRSTSQFTIAWV